MPDEQWFYAEGGQQRGPVSSDALRQLLASGQVKPDDLVWRDGMGNWQPAQSVPDFASAFAAPVASYASPAQPYGAPQPGYAAPPPGAGAYGGASPMFPMPGATVGYYAPQYQLAYAGFWLRFLAAFIDGIIILIPVVIVGVILYFALGVQFPTTNYSSSGPVSSYSQVAPTPEYIAFELITRVVYLITGWLYYAKQESGPHMATIGKRALGLTVTDLQGMRIGFGRASGRHFGKILSGCLCAVGYIMAAFTDKKQALHDQMASTLVLRKN